MTEKEAFCQQIQRLDKPMYALAYSVVKNDADAADVIGEAIFRGYQHMDTLKNEAAFRPWIMQIVHHTAVEFVRKNMKVIPFDQLELVEDDRERDLLTTLSLREAVKSLPQPYRTAIVLFYYEDFSVSQISQITGATAVTVKQRLSRGRKQLRNILKEDFKNV